MTIKSLFSNYIKYLENDLKFYIFELFTEEEKKNMDKKELKENFNYPKLSKDKELLDFKNDVIFICNEYSFIDKYCKTDEHLFMLVMHELYHKILGHTTLFGKTTIIENIVFDA